MLLFSITKRINKALAPKLLSWSLRLHEESASLASSTFSASSLRHQLLLFVHPFSLSNRLLLPLAQRLVSIEVQDDYLKIQKTRRVNHLLLSSSSSSSSSSWWDNFVDKMWSLFFQDYHERQTAKNQREQLAELQAQQLYNAKQKKRLEQQQQRRHHGARTTRNGRQGKNHDGGNTINHHHNELIELGNQRVKLLDRYIRPALLSSLKDLHRPLFMMQQHPYQYQSSTYYDNFVKWVRGEYLIAKYGLMVQKAVMDHPELRGDEYVENTTHDASSIRHQLPSVNTVIQAFGMQNWNRIKSPIPLDEEEANNVKLTDSSSSSISIEYIIHHKLGGQITHAGPLNAYFEMRRLWGRTPGRRKGEDSCYELWTREYIFGLAQYLLDRIAEMDREQRGPMETIILDVGAGDGRLSYFLRRAMEEIHHHGMNDSTTPPTGLNHRVLEQDGTLPSSSSSFLDPKRNASTTLPTIIATDDGSWNSSLMNLSNLAQFSSSQYSNFHVEQLSATESLQKYGPNRENYKNRRLIVLCSWMPTGQDWTADFRQPIDVDDTASISEGGYRNAEAVDTAATVRRLVDEYILIGEADNGTCGDNWRTWGNFDFYTSNACRHDDADNDTVAPYIRDGYQRVDLTELSVFQFSRFDCQRSSESKTVSFRRW